jgi:hypothetical protein
MDRRGVSVLSGIHGSAVELSAAIGQPVVYLDVTAQESIAAAVADGVPVPVAEALAVRFDSVLDGRNSNLVRGAQEALGRAPCDFGTFVASAVAERVWSPAATQAAR